MSRLWSFHFEALTVTKRQVIRAFRRARSWMDDALHLLSILLICGMPAAIVGYFLWFLFGVTGVWLALTSVLPILLLIAVTLSVIAYSERSMLALRLAARRVEGVNRKLDELAVTLRPEIIPLISVKLARSGMAMARVYPKRSGLVLAIKGRTLREGASASENSQLVPKAIEARFRSRVIEVFGPFNGRLVLYHLSLEGIDLDLSNISMHEMIAAHARHPEKSA